LLVQQISSSEKAADSPKKSSQKSPKKTKAVRRLQFDEDKSSPVSGTIIRDIKDCIIQEPNKDEHTEETSLGIQVSTETLTRTSSLKFSNAITSPLLAQF